MGVIKSSKVPLSASPFSMADIEKAAKSILLRAQQHADQLLASAQAEGEKLKAQARTQGYAEGQREGLLSGTEAGRTAGEQEALNEHRAQLHEAITGLSAATTAFNATRADLDASALREVVKLAIAIAHRVTKRQGLIEPEVLAANLEEAMKLVVQQSDLRIAIHPAQRQTLDGAMPQLSLKWPSLKHVDITEDATLAPGGCRISTRQGLVDADLDCQLDRIVNDLLPVTREVIP